PTPLPNGEREQDQFAGRIIYNLQVVEGTMNVTLNDTFNLKREFRNGHYDCGMPFWEATKQKKLVIQYCKTAKKYQHFPRPVSIFTGRRRDIEWREVSGKGKVFSYTIGDPGTTP